MGLAKKWAFIVAIFVLFIAILTPPIIYFYYFRHFQIGTNPDLWGVFGDFFGGVLNPILAFANLLVLGFLTYIVAKETNKQSKNLFITERRMTAYFELTKHFKSLNMARHKMNNTMAFHTIYQKLEPERAIDYMLQTLKELQQICSIYSELYFTLFSFNVNYGHLFQYDFNCNDYKAILIESKQLSETMDSVVNRYNNTEQTELDTNKLRISEEYLDLMVKVVNALKAEIEVVNK